MFSFSRLAFAAVALAVAAPAAAVPGLTLTRWYNLNGSDYYPTANTINAKIAEVAGLTPFSVEQVNFTPAQISNIHQPVYSAMRLSGTLNVAETGTYSILLQADDAARLTLGGGTLAEATFWGGGTTMPSYLNVNLNAGSYSFDLFGFQNVGGDAFYFSATGGTPGSLSFDTGTSVPEPAMLGLFGLGALGLVAARHRRA